MAKGNKIFHAALIALLCSCSENTLTDIPGIRLESEVICFSMPENMGGIKSGIVTPSDLESNTYIRATRGKKPVTTDYENGKLTHNATTDLWTLGSGKDKAWEYYDEIVEGTKKTQIINNEYSFTAYSYNNTNATGATITLTTSGEGFGKTFSIAEPETYTHSSDSKAFGLDYALSQEYRTTSRIESDKIMGDIVTLRMEHALADIQVDVDVSENIYYVGIKEISIHNFYREGLMECYSQALYGSGNTNKWASKNLINGNTIYRRLPESGSYIWEIDVNDNIPGATEAPFRNQGIIVSQVMHFCAIPQMLTANTTLRVVMDVKEATESTIHTIENIWVLSNYIDWESGKRNIYTVTLDPAFRLIATFDEWPSINNVQGTILPPINVD